MFEEISPAEEPTSVFILGLSRLGAARLGDGDLVVKICTELSEIQKNLIKKEKAHL